MNDLDRKYYTKHEHLPRSAWKATGTSSRVAGTVKFEPPENPCAECGGKGYTMSFRFVGKRAFQKPVACETCAGTGQLTNPSGLGPAGME